MFLLDDAIISVSNATKREIVTTFPISRSKIHVVHNGVDTSIFKPEVPDDKLKQRLGLAKFENIILSIGMLQERKGQEFVIRSIPHVLRERQNVCYVNVGGAYSQLYVNKITSLVENLGLSNHVRFFSNLPTDELVKLINLADVCVHPATREAFGLVVVEQMACGKPLVVSEAPAMYEIIEDKVNGFVVDVENPQVFSSAILNLLSNPKQARQIGLQALHKVREKFTWAKAAEKLLLLYHRLGEKS